MQNFVVEIRSIPIETIQSYLQEFGGELSRDGWTYGKGWQARLSPMDDYCIGSLRFDQVKLEWSGDEEALATMWQPFQKRITRPGG
ncbi:MAG: hypothetical protein ACOX6I_02855 [Syntrophomonadaceae bacterium]|jgi:hypothetical protein